MRNIEDRIKRNNQGRVTFTKDFRPWELAWVTEKSNYREAAKLERKFKSLKSKKRIKAFIEKYSR